MARGARWYVSCHSAFRIEIFLGVCCRCVHAPCAIREARRSPRFMRVYGRSQNFTGLWSYRHQVPPPGSAGCRVTFSWGYRAERLPAPYLTLGARRDEIVSFRHTKHCGAHALAICLHPTSATAQIRPTRTLTASILFDRMSWCPHLSETTLLLHILPERIRVTPWPLLTRRVLLGAG